MVTTLQIRQIHTLKSRLGLENDLYSDMLYSFGVCTSKDLTNCEAGVLIDILVHKAVLKGVWERKTKKYDDFDYRDDDYASSSQLRMIEGLWAKTCYAENEKHSLRKFLQNKFKVSDVRFLTKTKACKVIQALQIIKDKKQRESVG
jgi:hypothetical protein